MPIGQYNHPLFGLVKFKTKDLNNWVYGDPITFIDGFDSADVITVNVPQLAHVKGANGGKLRFHKRGQKQLLAAFADIENLGLLKHITSSAGAFYQRLKKPTSKHLSKEPSNHSFGIAVDLNSDDKCLGCTTAPLAPIFQNHGFRWGEAFHDPMHYEIIKFIDNASPAVKDVTVAINGNTVPAGAKNIFGDLFFDIKKIAGIPGLNIASQTEDSVSITGPKGSEILPKIQFGELSFAALPPALGLLGLKSDYDNANKQLTATPVA